MKWQDGAPFTSADVAFTFAQVMNPHNNVVSRFGYDDVKSLDTPDAYTVRLHLFHPFAPIVTTFFGDANTPYGILPQHVLHGYASLEEIPFNALPIGTGPFRVVSWRRGDRIELDANPNYFQGKPGLAHITIVFSRNEQTLVTLARSHEIDWAAELSPATAVQARDIPGYHVVLVPQNRWYGISFNMQRAVVARSARSPRNRTQHRQESARAKSHLRYRTPGNARSAVIPLGVAESAAVTL